jgi:hypothetical protein
MEGRDIFPGFFPKAFAVLNSSETEKNILLNNNTIYFYSTVANFATGLFLFIRTAIRELGRKLLQRL